MSKDKQSHLEKSGGYCAPHTTFLSQKTKGHKVYLRFDSEKYDADDTLMCYLYLENRTFLNMHLIKSQLAVTDVLRDFKYKEKFLSYQTT